VLIDPNDLGGAGADAAGVVASADASAGAVVVSEGAAGVLIAAKCII